MEYKEEIWLAEGWVTTPLFNKKLTLFPGPPSAVQPEQQSRHRNLGRGLESVTDKQTLSPIHP
jgi:hypothetical protein